MTMVHDIRFILALTTGVALIVLGVARWFYESLVRSMLGATEIAGGHWDEIGVVVLGLAVTVVTIFVRAGRLVAPTPEN